MIFPRLACSYISKIVWFYIMCDSCLILFILSFSIVKSQSWQSSLFCAWSKCIAIKEGAVKYWPCLNVSVTYNRSRSGPTREHTIPEESCWCFLPTWGSEWLPCSNAGKFLYIFILINCGKNCFISLARNSGFFFIQKYKFVYQFGWMGATL